MTTAVLIISIVGFIVSVVACIILFISVPSASLKKLKPFLIFHFSILCIFFFHLIINEKTIGIHLLSLAFFCSGLIISGVIIRSSAHVLLKTYFSLFIFLIVFFVISPGKFLRFISHASNDRVFQSFHLMSNYFLQEQNYFAGNIQAIPSYKVIQSFGIFHKTLARDIRFGTRIDSLRIINFVPDSLIAIRGYFSVKRSTFETPDSCDVIASLQLNSNQIIHKKLQQNSYAN